MEFVVPWRLLFPDSVFQSIAAGDGADLKHIAKVSGARIDVIGPAEPICSAAAGNTLVTLHGTMWQKRTAGRALVDRLFELLGVEPTKWWTFSREFSIVAPSLALEAITASDIQKSVTDVGATLNADAPADAAATRIIVRVAGNAQQVVSGVTRVHTILQDLADRGCASKTDFSDSQCPSAPAMSELVHKARIASAAGTAPPPPPELSQNFAGATAFGTRWADPSAATSCIADEEPRKDPGVCNSMTLAYPGVGNGSSTTTLAEHSANGHNRGSSVSGGDFAQSCNFSPGSFVRQCAGPQSQLPLLLPASIVNEVLLPKGHLASIAQQCGIRIDLRGNVPNATTSMLVTLTGTIAANAVAALYLQWCIAQSS